MKSDIVLLESKYIKLPKCFFTIFTWSLKCYMNETLRDPRSSPHVRRKRASMTLNNRNRTVFNGTSSGQRKL